jgi:hypothetical protein
VNTLLDCTEDAGTDGMRGGACRGQGGGRRQVRGWHPTDELAGGHQDAAGLSGRVHCSCVAASARGRKPDAEAAHARACRI